MRTSDFLLFGPPLMLVGFGLLARWYSAVSLRRFLEQRSRQGAAE